MSPHRLTWSACISAHTSSAVCLPAKQWTRCSTMWKLLCMLMHVSHLRISLQSGCCIWSFTYACHGHSQPHTLSSADVAEVPALLHTVCTICTPCCLQGLDEAVDKAEVITQLVADGQDNLAQLWVTALGRDYQVRGGTNACSHSSSSSSSRRMLMYCQSATHAAGATARQLHAVASSSGVFCALEFVALCATLSICCAAPHTTDEIRWQSLCHSSFCASLLTTLTCP
jgi:hypothetical protein